MHWDHDVSLSFSRAIKISTCQATLPACPALITSKNRKDKNLQAAIGPAANAIRNRIASEELHADRELPQSMSPAAASRRGLPIDEEQRELDRELDAIVVAAKAQGWTVRTRSNTAFRLVAKNGKRYSLAVGSPADTHDRLRPYAQQLNSAGLRVSQLVLRPVNDEFR